MDKEKLKLIVRNLELLIDSLKAEVYSDDAIHKTSERMRQSIMDYDEIFDDSYAD